MSAQTSWWVLDFRVIALFVSCVASLIMSHDVPLRPRDMVSLLEEGKRQYNLVQSKSTMPAFGSCWKIAISQLHGGCQHLDDRIQSEVALSFANCFLEGAGLPRHVCDGSDKALFAKTEDCLKTMTDRAFIAYTEFFTHTQSMCFFVMSQIWHEETEKTIDRLSTSAADVAKQLEASEELQEELLLHQRKSVLIQQELLENGVSLGSMLHESRDSLNLIFNEFRASTLEQQRLLSMVFHHLSALQSWIVGEISWVDSIAFYIPSFAFVYFLTSAQRTANARIPGLLVLLFAGIFERFISYILLSDGADGTSFQPVDIVNERLSWWVWLVRRCAMASNVVVLFVTLYYYRDREEVMHQLLEQIKSQNEELLNHIHGRVKTNGFSKSKNLDEADGFGYMPVLTSSSSSLSGHISTPTSRASPRMSHVKPVARTAPVVNGGMSPVRRVNIGIPTAHSAFIPIRENSPINLSPASSSIVDTTAEENDSIGVSPNINSSTPRINRSRKRDSLENSSAVSTRYNLRRSGRNSAVSLV